MTSHDAGRDSSVRKTAVLFSIHMPGISSQEHDASLAELSRLVTTLGLEVIAQVSQKRKNPDSSRVLGEGKLQELAAYTGGSGIVESYVIQSRDAELPRQSETMPHADVAVYDGEVTPTQLQNLENALGVEVLDRTGVILEIFSRHAKSREARLQIEIAKLGYLAPRLRASRIGGDRQGGGIGAKGAGETAHELDRRRIRDRIAELRRQLEIIQSEQDTRRQRRRDESLVALVGYTNAGKSSLMRALTGSEVYVADKLFATLDTRVRKLVPTSFPQVLISDTVGFIKKLPHDLVASFRSTLDEALAASLLLFVVDASDPSFRSQLAVSQKVLQEIGATAIESRLILNKIDQLDEISIACLQREYPEGIFLSAHNPEDVARLRDLILSYFERDMVDAELCIPYADGKILGEIRQKARILSEQHEDDGTLLNLRTHPETLTKFSRFLVR